MNRVDIPLKLPSLNDYIDACRGNRYKGAKMKKEYENAIAIFVARLPQFKGAIRIHFQWFEKNERRDPDNVAFAKKFILDTLVKLKKIPNDNHKYIRSFTDSFIYGEEQKVRIYIIDE